ncbi:PKD domain-containing protein, partial [Acaryochloris sp. IP29b_bin.137]|uniref:PKD domain-containing protein n=1 Tax=Acaryochloris sp. IP29b_bin.137 TaxID=2969217 RepID=UPI00262F7E77
QIGFSQDTPTEINPTEVSFSSSIALQQFLSSHYYNSQNTTIPTWLQFLQDSTPFNLNIEITDLPTGQLAEATLTQFTNGLPSAGTLTIDDDANGRGWFIDTTPWENSEFAIQNSEYSAIATPDSAAYGRYDLLTTILHELGHLQGIISGNHNFDQFVQPIGNTSYFIAPGITAQLTPDGSHLDSSAHPDDLMNPTLRPGVRKLPSALNLAILDAIWNSSNSNLQLPTSDLTSPLTAGALFGVLNGDFETDTDWLRRGDSQILNGQAVLSEDSPFLSNFTQTFIVPEGAQTLQFTLVNTQLGTSDLAPPDAFEVALLDANTLNPVGGIAAGLTQTDALLNLQANGQAYFGSQVQLQGTPQSGDTLDLNAPRTVQIDLSGVEAGTAVTLFLDLLGFGEQDSTITIDDVRLLTAQMTPPTASDDTAETLVNTATTLDVLANDSDPDGTLDPNTLQVTTGPNHGTLTVNADGTLNYTPESDFLGADGFTYVVQDNDGLYSNSAKVNVVVFNPAPVIDDLSLDAIVQEGTPARFSATATTASGDLTYTWDLGDGSDPIEGQTINPSYANNGEYTVTLTVTNDNGVSATETATVTVDNVAPTINLAPDFTADEGQPISFAASFTDPGLLDTHTITWDFGDGTTVSDTLTPEHIYTDNGEYTVALTITDNDGGTTTETRTVTVNNVAPAITHLTGDTLINEGDSATFSVTVTDSDSDTLTTTWDFGDGSATVTGTTVNHTYADNGTYTVTVTASDEDGGSTSQTLDIQVNNVAPNVDAGVDQTIDEGTALNFNGIITDPGLLDTQTVEWAFGDGATSGSLTPTHIFNDDGIYTVSLTATDNDGATTTDTLTVTVRNIAPTITHLTGDTSINEGDTATFTAFATDPGDDTLTYTWDFGDGSPVRTGDSVDHTFTNNGEYTVTLTVSDEDGGSSSETLTVTVANIAPTVTLGPDQTINEGETLALSGAYTDPGSLDTHTVEWTLGDGTTITDTLTPTHIYQADGIYSVTLTVTDSDGAAASASIMVTVRNVAPTITDLTGPLNLSEGETATFTATATDPGHDPLTYTWDFSDGSPSQTGSTVEHTFTDDGLYTISLTVTDGEGGSTTETVTVKVANVAPTITNLTGETTRNEGDLTPFTATATDPGADTLTYVWTFGDGSPALQSDTVSHTYADNGIYTATLTVSDEDGGSTSQTLTIEVKNVAPVVTIGDIPTVDEGQPVAFTASFTDPGLLDTHTILWDFGDGTTSDSLTPTHIYADSGLYTATLTITDQDGAATSATVTVTINNLAPTITSLVGDINLNEGDTGTFTATATDPGNDTLTYHWDFGDGSSPVQGPEVHHTFADNGLYTVTLAVTDEEGASTTQTLMVTVSNVAPTITQLNIDGRLISGGNNTFSAVATDPGDDALTYSWDFGDGSAPVTGPTVSHIYETTGLYTVTLTVTDEDGGITQQTQEVTIAPSGIFEVGESGYVSFDFLYDGSYQHHGELAIFSLEGMETYTPGSHAYIREAARRALSQSSQGHVIFRDSREGALFRGRMAHEARDWNWGRYRGPNVVWMEPGTQFAIMVVPNRSVWHAYKHPYGYGHHHHHHHGDIRPLFSIDAANPNAPARQIADLTGEGHTFAFESWQLSRSNFDYNDWVFQIQGATGAAANFDRLVDPNLNWRHSPIGQQIIDYVNYEPPEITISDTTVIEGTGRGTYAEFTLHLSAASTRPVTVAYTTENGSAVAGRDFQYTHGHVTFAPGETTQTVRVRIFADRWQETDESFFLNLTYPGNAILGDGQGQGTITNDDFGNRPQRRRTWHC